MKIFFAGIGGAGLSPLAQLCLDCGWEVVGSDREESLNTRELAKRGVTYSLDQTGKFLEEEQVRGHIDQYVFSSAVKSDNPEYQRAMALGIPTSKRSGLLNTILSEKNLKLLAVAGTHGKTTTTAMVVWLFKQLGISVSYSIGSNISFGPAAQYQEGSEWFVYECDEFDRNFLDFYPDVAIITSLDYDHPDTYPDQQTYYEAFAQFINQTGDVVCVWQEDWNKLNPALIKEGAKSYVFDPTKEPNTMHLNSIQLPGEHNRKNSFLAINMLSLCLGVDSQIMKQANDSFPGTQRRFEQLATGIYTDYAHHPSEIAATLQLAKEISDKVVIVYQPHQNIRQIAIQDQYTECFAGAARVYWLPTYLSREPEGIEVLSPQQLASKVKNTEVVYSNLGDTLYGDLLAEQASGSMIVFMGAGSVDGWAREHFVPKTA